MRFGTKLMLGFSSLLVLTGIAFLIIFLGFFQKKLIEDAENRRDSLSMHFRSELRDMVFTNDTLRLKDTIERFCKDIAYIDYIFVIGNDGRLLTHTFDQGFPTELFDVNPLPAENMVTSRFFLTDKGRIRDFAIRIAKHMPGEIHIGMDEEVLHKQIRDVVRMTILVMLVYLVLGLLSIYFISRRLSKPLENVAFGLEKTGEGDLDFRLEEQGDQETLKLIRGYNRMAGSIQKVVTRQQQSNKRIEHLNSLLRAIRNVNQLIVKEKDRDTLLQKACDALIETRGYDAAWLGFLSDDKTFTPVLVSGFREDISRFRQRITGGDHPPCVRNVLAGKDIVMIVNRSKDCEDCFLKDVCVGKEMVIIRIEQADKLFGLLAILIAPGAIADDEEKGLLEEIGSDIAFALHNIEWEENRKQAEEERTRLEAQFRQTQKLEAVGTLASGIAHDFNNILAAVIGYAELAKMRLPEDSKVIADMDEVHKAGIRARDLVRQILAASRQQEQDHKPIQIKIIVKEAVKLLRATLPSDIEIKEDVAREIGIVNADPTQIHQVIMNLCTNAGHAMQEDGGVLTVSLFNVEFDNVAAAQYLNADPGPYLRLTVSDTGHGMTCDVKERIFDPYFTTKKKGEGTGLGLSVVHGIVRDHGGTIRVYSEHGKGSTFHVYLPLIEGQAIKPEVAEHASVLKGNERILFIDDEQVLTDMSKQMLERLGYEVTIRTSSIEALELFHKKPDQFDLVITDMTMPKMTGDRLAKELMRIRRDIPIILCTGFSERISEEKAKGMGIKAFAMKPIVMQDMAKTVRKVLDEM